MARERRVASKLTRVHEELAPAWPRGYQRMGVALLEIGEFEAAYSVLESGLALDPAAGQMVRVSEGF